MFLNCSFSYSVSLGERKGMKGRGKVPNELAWKNEEAFDTEGGGQKSKQRECHECQDESGRCMGTCGKEPCLWHTYCGPKLSKMVATVEDDCACLDLD